MLSREYAKEKYSEILGVPIEHAIVQNLEKHTSNWAYIRTKECGDTPASNNSNHVQRYKQKFLSSGIRSWIGHCKTVGNS